MVDINYDKFILLLVDDVFENYNKTNNIKLSLINILNNHSNTAGLL